MAGKLIEPNVITESSQELVCVLPTGFYFDVDRWEGYLGGLQSQWRHTQPV